MLFPLSRCECPSGTHCLRYSDDISIAAYVFRCRQGSDEGQTWNNWFARSTLIDRRIYLLSILYIYSHHACCCQKKVLCFQYILFMSRSISCSSALIKHHNVYISIIVIAKKYYALNVILITASSKKHTHLLSIIRTISVYIPLL